MPSVVLLSATVGLLVVDQQTPLAIIALPASVVILAPQVAVVLLISDIIKKQSNEDQANK